jgi:pimeloyl-ACP methyl ester carboxylesterase
MPFAGDIHYRHSKIDLRDKTPLILVHGAGGTYMHWPGELRRLAGEDVLAIDLPGHGASPGEGRDSISAYSEDVREVLHRLEIDQVVIAGHSMGGAIALQFCLEFPEQVRGLILMGTGARLQVNPQLIQYCSDEATYPDAVSLVVKWSFGKGADEKLVELAGTHLAETPARVLHTDFITCDGFDVRDQLSEINQPTLVICGEQDKMMPVRNSQFLSEYIPGARLEIVPNAAHMVMLEQPEVVANLVKGFMEEINSNENNQR